MKNIKEWKTSLIGLGLMVLAVYTYLGGDFNIWIEGGIFISGIAFLFFPVSFLSILQKFLKRKSDQL